MNSRFPQHIFYKTQARVFQHPDPDPPQIRDRPAVLDRASFTAASICSAKVISVGGVSGDCEPLSAGDDESLSPPHALRSSANAGTKIFVGIVCPYIHNERQNTLSITKSNNLTKIHLSAIWCRVF